MGLDASLYLVEKNAYEDYKKKLKLYREIQDNKKIRDIEYSDMPYDKRRRLVAETIKELGYSEDDVRLYLGGISLYDINEREFYYRKHPSLHNICTSKGELEEGGIDYYGPYILTLDDIMEINKIAKGIVFEGKEDKYHVDGFFFGQANQNDWRDTFYNTERIIEYTLDPKSPELVIVYDSSW